MLFCLEFFWSQSQLSMVNPLQVRSSPGQPIAACVADGSLTHDWFTVFPIARSNWTTPGNTRFLGNRGKHPTSQAGGCIKIAGFGATGSHFRAIFTHRLPMRLVMGPGRRVEARSRCYKYFRFKRGILMKCFLCVVCSVYTYSMCLCWCVSYGRNSFYIDLSLTLSLA